MSRRNIHQAQAGYSILEMLIAMTVMLALMGVVFTFARDSIRTSALTFEMTDAQESVRSAHEFISRDLLATGDGLTGINNIRLPYNFVRNYLTTNPVVDPASPTVVNLSIITSDNNVAAGTTVQRTTPAVTVRSNPASTDRLTLMEQDRSFIPLPLLPTAINVSGSTVTIAAVDIARFSIGDIIFITSSVGATFAVVTNVSANSITLGNGDSYSLNQTGTGGPVNVISGAGTLATSIMRMQMIQYFVNSNGLLVRRVFGVGGGIGTRDSVVAEHVTDLQFRYALDQRNANGTIKQPVMQLTSGTEQVAVRQIETTLGVETTHRVNNGARQVISMTTSTSVRMMQFRRALQPGSSF